jgi:hypothetical protein
MPCAAPLAALLRAGIASRRGDAETAAAHLGVAAAGFADASMALLEAVAQRARARLAADSGGTATAEAAIRALGVVDPGRLAATLAPGL